MSDVYAGNYTGGVHLLEVPEERDVQIAVGSGQYVQEVVAELQQKLLHALSAAGFGDELQRQGSLEERLRAVFSLPYRHLVIIDGLWAGAAGWQLVEQLALDNMQGVLLLTARISINSPLRMRQAAGSRPVGRHRHRRGHGPLSSSRDSAESIYLQPSDTADAAMNWLRRQLCLKPAEDLEPGLQQVLRKCAGNMEAVDIMAQELAAKTATARASAAANMYSILEKEEVIRGVQILLQELLEDTDSGMWEAACLLSMLRYLKAVPLPMQLLELLWQTLAQPPAPNVQLGNLLDLLEGMCLVYKADVEKALYGVHPLILETLGHEWRITASPWQAASDLAAAAAAPQPEGSAAAEPAAKAAAEPAAEPAAEAATKPKGKAAAEPAAARMAGDSSSSSSSSGSIPGPTGSLSPFLHYPHIAAEAVAAAAARQLQQPSAKTAKLAVLLLEYGGSEAVSWAQKRLGIELCVDELEVAAAVADELQQLATAPIEAFEPEPAGRLNALLAQLCASMGKLEKADQLFRLSLAEEHPKSAAQLPTYDRWVRVLVASGTIVDAAAQQVAAINLQQSVQPAASTSLARRILCLGGLQEMLGEPEAARACYRQALMVAKQPEAGTSTSDHKIACLMALADLLQDVDRDESIMLRNAAREERRQYFAFGNQRQEQLELAAQQAWLQPRVQQQKRRQQRQRQEQQQQQAQPDSIEQPLQLGEQQQQEQQQKQQQQQQQESPPAPPAPPPHSQQLVHCDDSTGAHGTSTSAPRVDITMLAPVASKFGPVEFKNVLQQQLEKQLPQAQFKVQMLYLDEQLQLIVKQQGLICVPVVTNDLTQSHNAMQHLQGLLQAWERLLQEQQRLHLPDSLTLMAPVVCKELVSAEFIRDYWQQQRTGMCSLALRSISPDSWAANVGKVIKEAAGHTYDLHQADSQQEAAHNVASRIVEHLKNLQSRVAADRSHALALVKQGQLQEAQGMHRSALRASLAYAGCSHAITACCQTDLALCLMKLGEAHHLREAGALLQQVRSFYTQQDSGQASLKSAGTAAAAHNLAVWHEQCGSTSLAAASAQQAVEAAANADQAMLHAASLCLHARLVGNSSRAQEQYEAAIPLWGQALNSEHPVLVVTQASLAQLLSSGTREHRGKAVELSQDAIKTLAGPSIIGQDSSSLSTLLLQAQQELEAAESSSNNSSSSKLLRWMPDQDSTEYKQTVAQISSLSKLLQGRGPHDLPFNNASTMDISLTQMKQFARLPVTIEFTTGLASASDLTKEEEEKDKKLAAGKALACAQAVVKHLVLQPPPGTAGTSQQQEGRMLASELAAAIAAGLQGSNISGLGDK